MKVFITGSEGFIGSHLIENLIKKHYKINCFVQYNSFGNIGWLDTLPNNIKNKINIFYGDLRDIESIKRAAKGCETIINLASLIGIPYSYIAPRSYVDTNITGTLNILQTCLDLKIKKLIHTSTSEVYGSAQYIPMDEKHPLVGQSPYSASKIAADNLVLSYHYSFNVPVTILRPFNTFGPRQSLRAVIPNIISQIIENKKYIKIGSTSPTRDFNYVEDIVSGFELAINNKKCIGEVINLGTGLEISILDLINEISLLMNKKSKIFNEKSRIRPRNSEVIQLVADNSKAKKILEWKPKYHNKNGLIKGLKKTIKWFQDNKNINSYKSNFYNV